MKKVIVFLSIVIFSISISTGQEKPCDFEIYKLVFEESKLYKNKAVEVEKIEIQKIIDNERNAKPEAKGEECP